MGDIERIWSEGQITWIHKGTVQSKACVRVEEFMVEQGL